jgi:hypothetical protein
LSMVEKVDAYSMAAWSSAVLGDLDDAERSSADGLARIQPGQVPSWTLHLVSWRIYVLTLLGRWDEALQMGERARQLWLEAGKPAAGYANRGFFSVIDIARARDDDDLLESHAAILHAIIAAFPEESPFRIWLGYEKGDLTAVEAALRQVRVSNFRQVERVERGLNLLLDAGHTPPLEQLETFFEVAIRTGFRVLEAQVRRGLGIAHREPEQLTASLELWEGMGAKPYAARVRCERAMLTGDRQDLERGLGVLEGLGDRQQLGRFERLAVG